MSELQELIHKTSMHAYEQGVAHERERILKVLESQIVKKPLLVTEYVDEYVRRKHTKALIKLIKSSL